MAQDREITRGTENEPGGPIKILGRPHINLMLKEDFSVPEHVFEIHLEIKLRDAQQAQDIKNSINAAIGSDREMRALKDKLVAQLKENGTWNAENEALVRSVKLRDFTLPYYPPPPPDSNPPETRV